MILSAMSPAERLDNLLNSSFRSYIEDLFNFRKQIFYEYLLSDLWGLGGSTCLSENMQMGNLTTQTLCWTTCKTMSIISHKCDCCFLLSQAGQPKVNIYSYSKKSNVIFRYLNPYFQTAITCRTHILFPAHSSLGFVFAGSSISLPLLPLSPKDIINQESQNRLN